MRIENLRYEWCEKLDAECDLCPFADMIPTMNGYSYCDIIMEYE